MKAKKTKIIDSYQGYDLYGFTDEEILLDDFEYRDDLIFEDIRVSACKVIETMTAKGLTLSVCESITGGALASSLVSVSGASKVFSEGLVTYSNESKIKRLGVKRETIEKYGAVSYAVAREMATGLRGNCDYSVSTTGIAGPNGDGFCNKIGAVSIGVSSKNETVVKGFEFEGTREEIRKNSVRAALSMLLNALIISK